MAYHTWGARAKMTLLQEEFSYADLSRTLEPPLTDPISTLLYKKQVICTSASRDDKQTYFCLKMHSSIVVEYACPFFVSRAAAIRDYVGQVVGQLDERDRRARGGNFRVVAVS